jgi:hypothetical protein
VLAIIGQFGHGLTDIVHGLMGIPAFLKPLQDFRFPATRQLFQGADVQIAVVEVRFQLRHVLKQEAAILPDAVTTDWRFARRHPLVSGTRCVASCCARDRRQTVLAFTRSTRPLPVWVRTFQSSISASCVVGLMYGDSRPFRQNIQVARRSPGWRSQ